MALTKVTYSMIDAPVVNLADFDPAANGTTDDGAVILAAIAATPANGTLVIPVGNYGVTALEITRDNITIQLEGTLINITSTSTPPQLHTGEPSYGAPPNEVSNYPALYLNGCDNLTITGNGTISTPWYEAIKVVNCTNLTFQNFKIVGQRAISGILRGAWDAIWMNNCSNVVVDSLEIKDIGGIRQYVLDQRWSGNPNGVSGNGITINSSTIVTVQNCYIHDFAWQAIYLMDTTKTKILSNVAENGTGFCQYNALDDFSVTPLDYIIDGNIIRNMSGNGLDLSVGSTGVTLAAARITNNTFRYVGYLPDMTGQFDGAYISVNAPITGYITDIVFQGNIMEEGCTSYGVYLACVQNCVFSNNVVRNTGQMAFQLGICANINISDNSFQEIGTNFITLSNGTANPYIVVSGNIVNIEGFPVSAVGGATANQLNLIKNRFLSTTGDSTSIDLSNFVCDGNWFSMPTSINGSDVRVTGNSFDETALFRLTSSVVDGNVFNKSANFRVTSNTSISDNVVNKSAGDFNMKIDSIEGANTKLSVIGNIVYANNAGTAIDSTATNSVFANVSPDGTNSISGAGTTVLF